MEEKEHEITELRNTMLEKSDKSGSGAEAGCESACCEYQLCNDGFRSCEQPEHIEVHSAFTGGSGTDRGSDRDEWKT